MRHEITTDRGALMTRTAHHASRFALVAALATASLAAAAVTAAPAQASDEEKIREGSCSGRTDWKVKAKPDDGRIELEAEIDSNRNGQAWRWRIRHNGTLSARGTSFTRGPSGSFEVERRMADLAGTDVFVVRAVNKVTGERCRGAITL
jgi:hypothetical protein